MHKNFQKIGRIDHYNQNMVFWILGSSVFGNQRFMLHLHDYCWCFGGLVCCKRLFQMFHCA